MSTLIKPGVSLKNLQPQMLIALDVVADVCDEFDVPCVITDGWRNRKKHPRSLHPHGYALDFRTRDLKTPQRMRRFSDTIRKRLGKEYFCLMEFKKSHLHIEYDPDGS